jgi:hypothetical protein
MKSKSAFFFHENRAEDIMHTMHAFNKHIEKLWMHGHSVDYIVLYISSKMALDGNLDVNARVLQTQVQSEILRLRMMGFIPSPTFPAEVPADSWC